jgi:hypothetical protein
MKFVYVFHWSCRFLLTLWCLSILSSRGWAQDDFQTRELFTFKFMDTRKVDFLVFSQFRTQDNAKDFSFAHVSPQLKFDLWKNLSLGLNYSYLNIKVDDEFKFHHRLELEADPHWEIGGESPWLKIAMRNRYEFRWIEDQGSDNPRFRHRTQLDFPVKNAGALQAIFTNSEFFYDINDHRYNENWTVPFGMKFKVHPKASLSLFYMIQSKLSSHWNTSQVVGSHVFINF